MTSSKTGLSDQRMPVLFMGHGSPMNAIEENAFVKEMRRVGTELPTPSAILCVSAHWETYGTQVTAMDQPKTIHDFGGFPRALYEIQYPAPGDPQLATKTQEMVSSESVKLDQSWGLDHGAWSVIRHLFPKANVPVIQLSLNRYMNPKQHYDLARELAPLRDQGVLIIGSGNIVHNLPLIAWDKLDAPEYGFDWALEADARMKAYMKDGNHTALMDYGKQGRAFSLSIPTPEHYLPLLYTLALQDKHDDLSFFNDRAVGGSISMTSVILNPKG